MIEKITEFYTEIQTQYIFLERSTDVLIPPPDNTILYNARPLTRGEFLYGVRIAVTDLVQAISSLVLFLIATLATTCQSEFWKEGLFENASAIPTYLCAIPIGLIGAIIPQVINEQFMGIPSSSATDLSSTAP